MSAAAVSREELSQYAATVKLPEVLTELAQRTLAVRPADILDFLSSEIESLRLDPNFNVKLGAPGGASASAASSKTADGPPDQDDGTPYFLPYSPLDLEDESHMALLGRRYSEARGRRSGVSAEADESTDEDFEPKVYTKSEEESRRLGRALDSNFLFSSLDSIQRKLIFDAMFPQHNNPGDVIIQQGDQGDNFYVLDSGYVDIYIEQEGEEAKKVASQGPGGFFGELALMYGTPRAATVVAATEVRLWGLDRATYRHVLLETTMKKRKIYESFLERVPLLKHLLPYEKAVIADALHESTFQPGEVIIREGEPGDNFYIISEGSVAVSRYENGKEVNVDPLGETDYFGELALIRNEPRAATVRAKTAVTCVWLDRNSFTRVLGPCEEIMKRKQYS